MSIESILSEIAESGWLVNNLFQLSDGSWRANLRNENMVTYFGEGPTPAIALDEAIINLPSAIPIRQQSATYSIEKPINILETLGLKSKPVSRRRIG
jgi:hypothetical protein